MTTHVWQSHVVLRPHVIDRIDEPIDRSEVLRYLGYPAEWNPPPRIEAILSQWIEEAEQIVSAKAAFLVLPVLEKHRSHLCVDSSHGPVEFTGAACRFLNAAEALIVFIATAGPAIDQLASRLISDGENLPGLIVSSVGAERAEAAEAAAIDHVKESVRPIGYATTLPYSPGYCGLPLTEQSKLFGLFDGETVGVELTESSLMQPIKSISGLVGLAPTETIAAQTSPCDRCELTTCNMRR